MNLKKWSDKRPDRVCGYYVTYRWILAAFFLSILVTSGTLSPHPEYWFVYLTDLGFLVQSLHLVVSASVPVQLLLQSQSIIYDQMTHTFTINHHALHF